jgi:hypothetical protein
MKELAEIAEQLRTQDNRITADPMFCVQEKIRDWGYHADYADGHMFVDDDGGEYDTRRPGCRKVYYKDRWETIRAFFTEKAANDYIGSMRHRHGEMRTYVESYYRCYEMMKIRKWLMENH